MNLAHLRLGVREPVDHRDLDREPEVVTAVRPGHRSDVLARPGVHVRIDLDLGEGSHVPGAVMYGSHLVPAAALREAAFLRGPQPGGIPAKWLDRVLVRSILHGHEE